MNVNPRLSGNEKWYHAYGLANLAAGGSSVLLPLYAIHLGADVGEVGLLAAVGSLVSVPASILWGTLSDRWKARKYFIAFGFLGISVAFLLMALIESFFQLLMINGLFSLCWIAPASLATVMIVEIEERESWERKISLFNFVVGTFWLMGLIVGLVWSILSIRYLSTGLTFAYLFIFFALVSICAFIGSIFWTPGKIKFKKRSLKSAFLIRGTLLTERFRYLPTRIYFILSPSAIIETITKTGRKQNLFLLSVAFSFIGFSIFFVPLPVWLKENVGFSSNGIYLIFIINAAASAFFNNRAGGIIKRVGPVKSVAASLVARIILFPAILLPLISNKAAFIFGGISVILFLVGVSWSIVNIGNSILLASISSQKVKGQIFGIYNSILGLSGIFGALIGGYLAMNLGYLATYSAASFFILIGIIFFFSTTRSEQN